MQSLFKHKHWGFLEGQTENIKRRIYEVSSLGILNIVFEQSFTFFEEIIQGQFP